MQVGDRIGRVVAISVDIVENCSVSGFSKIDGPRQLRRGRSLDETRRTEGQLNAREVRRSNVQKYSTFV